MAKNLEYKWIVAGIYILGLFMTLLDLTVTNVALPDLANRFGVSPTAVSWVATSYLLSVAVAIPVSGWLSDRHGAKRTFLAALVLFTAGSLLCGLAWSLESLVGFRVLQGIGGGLLTPIGAAMLYRAFPLAERARAAAIVTIPAVLAPTLGPVVGGYLVEFQSWRWIFFINVPLGLLGLAFAARSLIEYRFPGAARLDVAGFVLSALGLAATVFALTELGHRGTGSPAVRLAGAVGITALALFVVVELRSPAPMIDPRLYRDRLFAISNAVLFCANAGFFGVVFLLPLLLQTERGLSPLASGLTGFPTALGIMAAAPAAGRLYGRVGPRRLIMTGMAIGVLASLALGRMDLATDLWIVRGLTFAMGAAFGLIFIPLQAAAFAGISAEHMGRATAAYNAVRQVAVGAGIALLATVLAVRLQTRGASLGDPGTTDGAMAAFADAYAAAAVVFLIGLGFAFLVSDRLAAATMTPVNDLPSSPTTNLQEAIP